MEIKNGTRVASVSEDTTSQQMRNNSGQQARRGNASIKIHHYGSHSKNSIYSGREYLLNHLSDLNNGVDNNNTLQDQSDHSYQKENIPNDAGQRATEHAQVSYGSSDKGPVTTGMDPVDFIASGSKVVSADDNPMESMGKQTSDASLSSTDSIEGEKKSKRKKNTEIRRKSSLKRRQPPGSPTKEKRKVKFNDSIEFNDGFVWMLKDNEQKPYAGGLNNVTVISPKMAIVGERATKPVTSQVAILNDDSKVKEYSYPETVDLGLNAKQTVTAEEKTLFQKRKEGKRDDSKRDVDNLQVTEAKFYDSLDEGHDGETEEEEEELVHRDSLEFVDNKEEDIDANIFDHDHKGNHMKVERCKDDVMFADNLKNINDDTKYGHSLPEHGKEHQRRPIFNPTGKYFESNQHAPSINGFVSSGMHYNNRGIVKDHPAAKPVTLPVHDYGITATSSSGKPQSHSGVGEDFTFRETRGVPAAPHKAFSNDGFAGSGKYNLHGEVVFGNENSRQSTLPFRGVSAVNYEVSFSDASAVNKESEVEGYSNAGPYAGSMDRLGAVSNANHMTSYSSKDYRDNDKYGADGVRSGQMNNAPVAYATNLLHADPSSGADARYIVSLQNPISLSNRKVSRNSPVDPRENYHYPTSKGNYEISNDSSNLLRDRSNFLGEQLETVQDVSHSVKNHELLCRNEPQLCRNESTQDPAPHSYSSFHGSTAVRNTSTIAQNVPQPYWDTSVTARGSDRMQPPGVPMVQNVPQPYRETSVTTDRMQPPGIPMVQNVPQPYRETSVTTRRSDRMQPPGILMAQNVPQTYRETSVTTRGSDRMQPPGVPPYNEAQSFNRDASIIKYGQVNSEDANNEDDVIKKVRESMAELQFNNNWRPESAAAATTSKEGSSSQPLVAEEIPRPSNKSKVMHVGYADDEDRIKMQSKIRESPVKQSNIPVRIQSAPIPGMRKPQKAGIVPHPPNGPKGMFTRKNSKQESFNRRNSPMRVIKPNANGHQGKSDPPNLHDRHLDSDGPKPSKTHCVRTFSDSAVPRKGSVQRTNQSGLSRIAPQGNSDRKESTGNRIDDNLNKTPTDDEINDLWYKVRNCLTTKPPAKASSDSLYIAPPWKQSRTWSGTTRGRSNGHRDSNLHATPNNKQGFPLRRYGSQDNLIRREGSLDNFAVNANSRGRSALLPQRSSKAKINTNFQAFTAKKPPILEPNRSGKPTDVSKTNANEGKCCFFHTFQVFLIITQKGGNTLAPDQRSFRLRFIRIWSIG